MANVKERYNMAVDRFNAKMDSFKAKGVTGAAFAVGSSLWAREAFVSLKASYRAADAVIAVIFGVESADYLISAYRRRKKSNSQIG